MVHRFLLLIALTSLLVGGAQDKAPRKTTWRFSQTGQNSWKDDWLAGVTGAKQGQPPRWTLTRDGNKTVLAQLEPGGRNGDFPVCLKRGSSLKDGTVTIRFKSISGRIDQAGGVVFRAKDLDNFYVARANALEDNVSIYVTRNGKRQTIKYWENIPVARGKWHDLSVRMQGNTFTVFLDGKVAGRVTDPAGPFSDAGMVGFWTKADSITYFESLTIEQE